ncbi:ATP-binding protein [Desulfobacterales bacterium HSG17]|nr:ATP-binding protein [Desulfobacterales bacterium HSG17]
MFSFTEDDNSISFVISSEMKLIDRIVRESRIFLGQRGLKIFSEFKIVLRELLINAVEHGSSNMAQKKIFCTIEQEESYMMIINVRDEGKGFDYKNINYEMPDVSQSRLRGYPLIREFSEDIRFNNSGNSIFAMIRIKDETYFDIRENDGWQIICPDFDITAAVADKFRVLLSDLVEKGSTLFRFDLKNVKDIDSVGLGVFFLLPTALSEKSFKLEIINADMEMINLFRLTKLDTEFEIKGKNNGT